MIEDDEDGIFLQFPVLEVKKELATFYAASIKVRDLLRLCYAHQLEAKETDDGYVLAGQQRSRVDKRLKDIGEFIRTTEATFPGAVILAANYLQPDEANDANEAETEADDGERERAEDTEIDEVHDAALVGVDGLLPVGDLRRWELVQTAAGLELTIRQEARSAAVIDGQHRLFAFAEVPGTPEEREQHYDTELLCSVFLDLPRPYQAYVFATVNANQKPVSRSLTYELFGYNVDNEPREEWSSEKLAVSLVRRMQKDKGSPFHKRIAIAALNDFSLTTNEGRKIGEWIVSLATVVDGILRLVSSNPKRDAYQLRNPEKIVRKQLPRSKKEPPLRKLYIDGADRTLYDAVNNFFEVAFEKLEPKMRTDGKMPMVTRTIGIQALFDLLRLIAPALLARKKFTKEAIREELKGLENAADGVHELTENFSGSGRTVLLKIFRRSIQSARLSG